MQIENHLPFPIVVRTYDAGDVLYWIPAYSQKVAGHTTSNLRAHDGGRCKIKIEIIDGPRTWVLDRPDERVYTDSDVLTVG
jgi:hypothetical protein